MKRNIYLGLVIATLVLLGYVIYYVLTHKETAPVISTIEFSPIVATTTPEVEKKEPIFYTTSSGKKIQVAETNPIGESLSTITVTTIGFATDTPIVIETNKLSNFWYADLNKDTHEELIITTTSQGSGGFGEVIIFTTASSSRLLPVTVPAITEKDTEKGNLFEGYMGRDSFALVNGRLVQEFPTYNKTDVMSDPTGPRRSVIYTLSEKNGSYSITFLAGVVSASSSTGTSPTFASSSTSR